MKAAERVRVVRVVRVKSSRTFRQKETSKVCWRNAAFFLPEVDPTRLLIADMENGALGVGWSGMVLHGSIDGVKVAIKSAKTTSQEAQVRPWTTLDCSSFRELMSFKEVL